MNEFSLNGIELLSTDYYRKGRHFRTTASHSKSLTSFPNKEEVGQRRTFTFLKFDELCWTNVAIEIFKISF